MPKKKLSKRRQQNAKWLKKPKPPCPKCGLTATVKRAVDELRVAGKLIRERRTAVCVACQHDFDPGD